MTDGNLVVYGSKGDIRYPSGESGSNLAVESDWASGRMLILEHTADSTLLRCYINAQTGSHSEQLYLEFETESTENLFERFTNAVDAQLVEGLGWTIDDSPRNRLFQEIRRAGSANYGELPTDKISELLRDDRAVRATTSDHSRAIGLVQQVLDTGYDVTIADDPDALKSCDLGIAVDSQYQSQISLSKENEAYYRKKRKAMKKRRLHEALSSAVQDVRTELGEAALVEALQRELSGTQYRLVEHQRQPDTGESGSLTEETDAATGYSIYTRLSYGLNAVIAFAVLLYVFEMGMSAVGYSLAETAGAPIDELVVAAVAIVAGYGSLGIASDTSYLSRKKAIGLGAGSLLLSAAIAAAVLQTSVVRTSVPQTVAGLPWWSLLSVIPPALGLAEIARTQAVSTLEGTEVGEPTFVPSKVTVAGGVGMLAGFVIGVLVGRELYVDVLNSSLVVQLGGGLAVLLIIGAVAATLYNEELRTQLQTLGIAVVTLIGGVVVSYGLFTWVVPATVGGLPVDVLLGIVFVVGTGAAIEYLHQSTSLFEESPQLEILQVDGDGDVVPGPKFEVEGYNKTGVEWVTVELHRDDRKVDDDITQTGAGDAPYRFIGRLEADENGSYTVRAYSGRDGFSGHRGGKDRLEITVTGVSGSVETGQDVSETTTTWMMYPHDSSPESQTPNSTSSSSGPSSAEESQRARTSDSPRGASEPFEDSPTSGDDRPARGGGGSSTASAKSDSVEAGAGSDDESEETRDASESEDALDSDSEPDSEENSDSGGYDWEYTL